MVMRTIEIKEISFDVEEGKKEEIVKKLNQLYPSLKIKIEGNKVSVSGDLHNYKRRDMIIWILSGGKHGKNIHAS